MKKIGIYNPYLETKGGGEKVCLAMASVLARQGHDVTLIVYGKIDLPDLARYFGTDLSQVKLTIVKQNVLAKIINRLPLLPGGIRHFFSDVSIYRAIKKKNFDVFINNCFQSNLPNPSRYGIYMCMFPQKIMGEPGRSQIKRFYLFVLRGMYRFTLHLHTKHAVYTYDVITANSKFTQSYVEEYWKAKSTVLYPLCDDMHDRKAGPKENIILHVGRFFERNEANHHKRQDFLVGAFKKMRDLHKAGWELHFTGSVAEDVGGLKYILNLMREASGYPIYFHFNCSFRELKQLYNKASVYWHATGYGVDPGKHPEKQEHFGISTVEAMSASCIPVVINSAGQKESVLQNRNGFLWSSRDELIDMTAQVANLAADEREIFAKEARNTAKQFGGESFRDQILALAEKF